MSVISRTKLHHSISGNPDTSGKFQPALGKLDSAGRKVQTSAMQTLSPFGFAILGLITLLHSTIEANAETFLIRVETGEFERQQTVVRVALPESAKPSRLKLRQGDKLVPWQDNGDGSICFSIDRSAKNNVIEYELTDAKPVPANNDTTLQLDLKKSKGRLDITVADKAHGARALMSYQADPGDFPRADIKPVFKRGGYLHPILTPSGRLVTDDFPPNHVHHHGVWSAWTHTKFNGREPDFWNMGDGKGRVEFDAVEKTWEGKLTAGFRSRHRFVDLTSGQPVTALNETWEVIAYTPAANAKAWFFDLVSSQDCATTNALRLPEYRYGGVGLRGNWAWNGKDKTFFLTANGEADREKGHATRARWCDMGGNVEGNRVGIAILDHPLNFRHPQPMRIHPTEPFFNYAPQQAGDMELKPGTTYVSRYRFVVHDGPPDRTELDRMWNDFAHPPKVTVVRR